MTAQLGALTVHLAGGKVARQIGARGVITMIRGEIKTAIDNAIAPDARNEMNGKSGTNRSL